ncbi:MAG: hypothetical protein AAGA35_03465 [Patescibacteria group bacterium]
MEQVVIDGITYEKAAKVAKQFRYTKDYIGQLCRSGKVDAKLIGRSWFVNPETLTEHKKARYQKNAGEDGVSTKDEAKKGDATESSNKRFLDKITWNKVSYETDNADLFPQVKKDTVNVSISVDPAEAEQVDVVSESQAQKLVPTEIPEVSLTGVLKVASLETYYEGGDDVAGPPEAGKKIPAGKSAQRSQLQNASGQIAMRRGQIKNTPRGSKKTTSLKRDNKENKSFLDKISEKQELKSGATIADKVHEREAARVPSFSPQSAMVANVVSAPKTSFLLVHVAVIVSAIVVIVIMSLDSKIISDNDTSTSSFEINFANLNSFGG